MDTESQLKRARDSTEINAAEIFGKLYRKSVSPFAMIDAFSVIGNLFRSRACAVILSKGDTFTAFDLPVRFRGADWIAPTPLTERHLRELKDLQNALTIEQHDDHRLPEGSALSVIDLAHRRFGANDLPLWSLLLSCRIQPSSGGMTKRTTGDARILLINEGHRDRCHFKNKVEDVATVRCADEGHDLCAVFFAYFDQMLRDLSFVPMAMIQAEWSKALHRTKHANSGDARHRAGLPWGEDAPRETPTITLSLDLRKSTFAMQQTRDRKEYAGWLEAVAELAREITLQNGGIFDKFTGDGVICHFVYPAEGESKAAGKDQALLAAISCAVELIRAMQLHIGDVISQLKFTSGAFGPAVGMAVDMATWSLDRDGKPVVVGQGIVNACRLNGGDAGQIILTNDLKHMILRLVPSMKFEQHPLGDTHKEFPAAMKAECWRMIGFGAPVGRSDSVLQAEVARVRKVLER